MYILQTSYYKEHNNLLILYRYKTKNGIKLGI